MSEFQYGIFGLRLRANQPLPGLERLPRQAAVDVELHLARSEDRARVPMAGLAWVPAAPPLPVWTAEGPGGYYLRLRYEAAGADAEFVIGPRGGHVWVSWSRDVTLGDVAAPLLGPVLGCVLRRRGATCLHGAALAVDGRAIVLLGVKGAGKSTTALALVRQGATLLADDITVLSETASGPSVLAGPARLRLRPEPVAALCGPADVVRPMWSQEKGRPYKRYLDLPSRPTPAAAALAAIYLLGPRGEPIRETTIVEEPILTALPRLMAQRYVTFALDRDGQARDFESVTRLVRRIPVRQIHRPEGLERIDTVALAIVEDARALLLSAASP
ncbi:MAG TPA: hypothetical protein VFL93_08780 [Longimicrobiaceae bacterium]|nr:hypothetical protein [Longimicrobiaceae bacterium]